MNTPFVHSHILVVRVKYIIFLRLFSKWFGGGILLQGPTLGIWHFWFFYWSLLRKLVVLQFYFFPNYLSMSMMRCWMAIRWMCCMHAWVGKRSMQHCSNKLVIYNTGWKHSKVDQESAPLYESHDILGQTPISSSKMLFKIYSFS